LYTGSYVLKVSLNLSGRFAELFDVKEDVQMEVEEGTTIQDILKLLCKVQSRSSDIFFSNTGLKPNVTVTVNGRFIIHLDWLDTVISENDRLNIFTLHSGG